MLSNNWLIISKVTVFASRWKFIYISMKNYLRLDENLTASRWNFAGLLFEKTIVIEGHFFSTINE
jgi:hypothetical protein